MRIFKNVIFAVFGLCFGFWLYGFCVSHNCFTFSLSDRKVVNRFCSIFYDIPTKNHTIRFMVDDDCLYLVVLDKANESVFNFYSDSNEWLGFSDGKVRISSTEDGVLLGGYTDSDQTSYYDRKMDGFIDSKIQKNSSDEYEASIFYDNDWLKVSKLNRECSKALIIEDGNYVEFVNCDGWRDVYDLEEDYEN